MNPTLNRTYTLLFSGSLGHCVKLSLSQWWLASFGTARYQSSTIAYPHKLCFLTVEASTPNLTGSNSKWRFLSLSDQSFSLFPYALRRLYQQQRLHAISTVLRRGDISSRCHSAVARCRWDCSVATRVRSIVRRLLLGWHTSRISHEALWFHLKEIKL